MPSLAAAAGARAAQNGKQLPPAGGGQCAVVTAFINGIITPPSEPNLKPRAPLGQNPGAVPEARLPPLTSRRRPARRAGTAVAVIMDAVTNEFVVDVGFSCGFFLSSATV